MSLRPLLYCLALIAASACAPRVPASTAPTPLATSGAPRVANTEPRSAPVAVQADTERAARISAPSTFAPPSSLVATPADTFAFSTDAARADPAVLFPLLELDQYAGHSRVDYYLKLFTGDARARMGQRLSLGTRYGPLIRDKLRASGIPEEITYLALIESGYDPHAYSSAAAVGMWQFMTRTARGYGLRVDWWVDERRDPVRATDAAIRYLTDLRGQFGSIYLAAAAYNGGAGRVSRGLTRLSLDDDDTEPDDKFFTLASSNLLKTETRNYVPQLIAAAIVGRDPLAYGITVDTLAPVAFDSIAAPPATALAGVAKACGSPLSEVRELNGQILRGMTPPDGVVWLRVPAGCGATFAEAFVGLDSAEQRGAIVHVVKKGETPSLIAKNAGISLATWRRYNPKIKTAASAAIGTGQHVLLPTRATIQAARDVPDPGIERYGVAVGGSYVVKKGDTLGGIAARNRTTVAAIQRANGMKSDKIVVGQKLRVPK